MEQTSKMKALPPPAASLSRVAFFRPTSSIPRETDRHAPRFQGEQATAGSTRTATSSSSCSSGSKETSWY